MVWLLASTLRDVGRGAHPAKELQPLDTRRPPCPCGPEESAFPASTWPGLRLLSLVDVEASAAGGVCWAGGLAPEPRSMQGAGKSGALTVPPGQAEPAAPCPPPHAGPHWGEQGWSVSELLLRQAEAGF